MSTQAHNAGTGDFVALLLDDDIPASRLGAMLLAARKRRGMKRRRVAARVGISRDDLRAYERGTLAVPAEICARLAECYGDDLTAHVPLHVPVQVEDRWIVAGDQALAHSAATADEVLRNYVDVLTRLRGAKPGEPVALRSADLSALAAALGDDPHAIEVKIVDLLGCSREEAAHLRSELLRRKVILPVAGLAAGAALFAAAGAGAQGTSPQPIAPSPTTVSAAEPDWNVVDEDVPRAVVPRDVAVEAAPSSTPPATAPPAAAPEPAPAPETTPPTTPAAPETVTDATVPPSETEDDVPVSIPEGEVFVEIGDAITEP